MKSSTVGVFLAAFTLAWGIARAGLADGSTWENNGALNGPYGALGNPGSSGTSGSAGGSGADAGAAAEITETSAVNGVSGTAAGGNGGSGGSGGEGEAVSGSDGIGGQGGNGGSGGMGVTDSGLQILNAGEIGGGDGGDGGSGGDGDGGSGGDGLNTSIGGDGGDGGSGGTGVVGNGLQVTNAGEISGGDGGNGGNSGAGNNGGIGNGVGFGGDGVGGGSGGTGVSGGGLRITNAGEISGGDGGNGGNGGNGGGGAGNGEIGGTGIGGNGGGGGSGGTGVVGSGLQIANTGTISGGDGGSGGSGGASSSGGPGTVGYGGGGGGGGSGGTGVVGSGLQVTNAGTISGGAGGFGGSGGAGFGSGASGFGGVGGVGGAGVSGSDLVLTDSGAISGGLAADGATRADAVEFTGGVNSLILEAGYSIVGAVAAYSPGDSLILGGSGDAAFDASGLGADGSGAQYQGFGSYEVDASEGAVWTLSGSAPVSESWIVESGTLEAGGSADPLASVAVEPGGTLAGYGTVGGVVNGGVVAPGLGHGALAVSGNYQQNPAGTLRIEVSPSQASQLAVAGTASLAGTLDLVLEPGLYQHDGATIVSAADGVGGTFSRVEESGAPWVAADLAYAPDAVDLTLDTVVPSGDTVYTALDDQALLEARQSDDILLDRLDSLALGLEGPNSAQGQAKSALADAAGAGLWPGLPEAVVKLGGWVQAQGDFDRSLSLGPPEILEIL